MLTEGEFKILVNLLSKPDNGFSITDVSKTVNMTYNHTHNKIESLESDGILETKKNGNKRTVSLTKEGREIAELMKEMRRKYNELCR